jgi:hypothetical protein
MRRLAWRPQRKKYMPDVSAARLGVQDGAATKALSKITPSLPMRSSAGVRSTSFKPGRSGLR